MAELKTFLFTDIVRSVDLKRQMPGQSDTERDQAFIQLVLMPHRQQIERELAALGGRVVSTAGDGHFLVFSDTVSAARWAIGIQKSHRDEPIRTPGGEVVSVRVSMHLGIPQADPHDPNNFVGKPVDYASRLSDYATGGQILASRSVAVVLEDAGVDGVTFHHHGRRELKGIGQIDIYELVYDRAGPRQMRKQPRESISRQWTVLPATMGFTEFKVGSGSAPMGSGEAHQQGAMPAQQQLAAGAPGVQPKSTSDVAPMKLGNYVLEERLGTGGMGEVYRARHTQFGRPRAVKIIRQHFLDAGNQEVVRRFYQEIKAVGALEHPNIVVAIDSSAPTDAVHYLVMEYIDGVGADALISRRSGMAVADACEIVRQAARGLAYIHQHGMVHRDIKPSNLMLTVVPAERAGGHRAAGEPGDKQVVVKILDLGLALLVGEDQQRLTVFDQRTMGTAMYMSPEQWKTTSVDIRADIYSLGCSLYHLLSGRPPFFESDLKPEKAHEREKLPPIESAEPIPKPLWEILKKMTAKDPADRFADPNEVAAAVAPFAAGHQLVPLVEQTARKKSRGSTDGFAKSDTQVAKSAESDTRLAQTPMSWGRPPSLPAAERQKFWRGMIAVITLAAVVTIGWLAWQATARRRSEEQARESAVAARQARGHALQVAAGFAASEILREINLRFGILSRLAADGELQKRMNEILRSPNDKESWTNLENWLGARKADNEREAPADSWFINDVRGVQVARSPRSDASRGATYAHRDYFHGQGFDLPEGTPDLKPITARHLSAVYRSTSTGHLKVAFSVPIENGLSGKERGVVGVLAMSVDLGEFNVLEKQLPPGHEVVLIDLRRADVDGESRRGLVLHHQVEAAYDRGNAPPWIGSELLAQIDQQLASTAARNDSGASLMEYRDPAITRDKPYWGAPKAVIDRRPDDPPFDTRWLVLVQEPVEP